MPGFLLHQGATVLCAHGGQAQPILPNLRVKVGGKFIVIKPVPHLISGCPFNVAGGPSPCLIAQWKVAAVRVRAGGQPVLLKDSQATCIPNGTPVNIRATQIRVKGI